jgi:hypothetical protein
MIDHCPFILPSKYVKAFEDDLDLNFESRVNIVTSEQTSATKKAHLFSDLTSYPKQDKNNKQPIDERSDYVGSISIKNTKKDGQHIYFNINLQHIFNRKKDNSRQFKISQVIFAINEILAKRFNFNPADAKMQPFEYGVNVQIKDDPNLLLDNIIMHKFKRMNQRTDKNQNFLDNYHSNAIKRLKIYNKGLQYPGNGFLLRIENDIIRNKAIAQTKIKTLADLTDVSKLKKLTEILIQDFSWLLVYDWTVDRKKFDDKTKIKLLEGNNFNYWKNIKNSNTKSSKKRDYKQLMIECSGRDVVAEYTKCLQNQIDLLFDVNGENTESNALSSGYFLCENKIDDNASNLDHASITTISDGGKFTINRNRGLSVSNDQIERNIRTDENRGLSVSSNQTYNHLKQPERTNHTGMLIFKQWQGYDPKLWILDPQKFPVMTTYNLQVLTENLQITEGINISPDEYFREYCYLLPSEAKSPLAANG